MIISKKRLVREEHERMRELDRLLDFVREKEEAFKSRACLEWDNETREGFDDAAEAIGYIREAVEDVKERAMQKHEARYMGKEKK